MDEQQRQRTRTKTKVCHNTTQQRHTKLDTFQLTIQQHNSER